ncbi:hypothetical protein [Salinicoccus roseus]|uniref:hypothetical protein n=1 Tax=Salinicoccus roseus TaxID=45670 RepID=UPI00230185B5|nr:hypothetical protein [Salinicoccus roseus]
MDKYDYVESIFQFLKGVTGINYQLQIKEVLSQYYKNIGKTYEMPDYYGGDQKNDGWVAEDAIFYQVFAPTRLKNSLKKEIQDKFKEDLSGLLEKVCNEKQWSGEIKEFIFIVNTFDNNLPHDSERYFETTVTKLQKRYGVNFNYRVVNTEYIREVLIEIQDIEVLKRISSTLHIKSLIDSNGITEKIIMDLVIGISGNLSSKSINKSTQTTYERISTSQKIDINNLGSKREEIEWVISELDVVERAINSINQDIISENKFDKVKDFVIGKYEDLSSFYNGEALYEKIVETVLSYSNDKWTLEVPMKFLVIYIFDKCDIFEKTGDSYDTP